MIEMTIESIRMSLMNYQRVVILKEKIGERYLPIWIGPAEADAIAIGLQEVALARPLTHDLLHSVINDLGATVSSIIVNDLANDTFYGRIILETKDKRLEIDSRPSDAIALAVRAQVPIYADESVLDKAGILFEGGKAKLASSSEVSEEELKRLSAFRDLIDSLDLDDFDKREPS
jgi:hypothetical protein